MSPRLLAVLGSLLLGLAATGCGRPFHIQTAPGMLELENQGQQYDYRAMSPEGVVLAVRAIDIGGRGDLEFWARIVAVRMHQHAGYALLGASDIKSRDGTPGRELRFGHDESSKPFLYAVRLYVAQGRLFLLETGGPTEAVQRYAPTLSWMAASIEVRCGGFLSPVLSSHTCNRW